MNQDFFKHIPSHIIIDILSCLPVRAIARSKCVCKSWLHLLHTPEFVNRHLSKSASALALFHDSTPQKHTFYTIHEFEDEPHLDLYNNLVTDFNLPACDGLIQGSANGFLFLRDFTVSRRSRLFICNPITREYLQIHCPEEFLYTYPQVVTFGFGANARSGQHKVVRIFHDCIRDEETGKLLRVPKTECQVYTLGTGSWRSTTTPPVFEYNCRSVGAFLNGNLHWLVHNLNQKPWISVFDLETELFSSISPPRCQKSGVAGVFALGDRLCISYHTSDNEIVIWLMKEYGVERSWTKEFVITDVMFCEPWDVARPIKVLEDGILMAWEEVGPFYFSSKTRTMTTDISMFGHQGRVSSMPHTLSFLSLPSFGMEDVCFF